MPNPTQLQARPEFVKTDVSSSGKYKLFLARMFDQGEMKWIVGAMLNPEVRENNITPEQALKTARVRIFKEEHKHEAWKFYEEFVGKTLNAPREEDGAPEGYIQ